ncbi:hypothetical protein OCT51_10400 [Halomonas sp. LR3S48]|uniref:hypothetical protein n=1 Tax=Halomonas sp. LR3S48 TaxID=2982694 RepID=UPI0021E461D8|nr:hypothetical protein [Halomonas sp. LR3S48]UYG05741.1 hypothetical protein OCT51_10400 [Halomonas sp. LR3S48]
MEIKDWLYIVSIALTFAIGVWNLVLNYRNTRQTRFINTVTSQRIQWLEQLRQDISSFAGLTYTWSASAMEGKPQEYEIVRDIDKLRYLIRLRLNPNGEHDQKIEELMDEVIRTTDPSQSSHLRELLSELTRETQLMLKAEWEKVKLESVSGKLNQITDS